MIDLRQGDCLELMKDIPDKSIDMILCDLPYGVTQNKQDITLPFDKLWENYERIIKDNGAILLFGQGTFYVDLVNSNRKLFRYDLVWDKQLTSGFLNAKRMPLRQHEQIAVFYKKLPTYNPQFKHGKPHPSIAKHRTEKPVALLEYLIKTYTNEDDLVLDNCMGSGSTGVACINTNRNFIGIELSEEYYNIAKERINNIVRKD